MIGFDSFARGSQFWSNFFCDFKPIGFGSFFNYGFADSNKMIFIAIISKPWYENRLLDNPEIQKGSTRRRQRMARSSIM